MLNTNQALSVERYDNILSKVKNENKNFNITIGADQNFDCLKTNENEYIDLLNSFISAGLVSVITKPTRITHTSATLINNIHTNLNTNKYYRSKGIDVMAFYCINTIESHHRYYGCQHIYSHWKPVFLI